MIRIGVMGAAFLGLVICFAVGWTKQRLAAANRDPRIPAHEFNGLMKSHYTPTGQAYLRQARACLIGFMVCFAIGVVLGMLGNPL